MKFIPLGDRIVVKAEPIEEITKGGIILSETSDATKSPTTGVVIAVGPGRYSNGPNVITEAINTKVHNKQQPLPMSVKVNDVVMWTKFAGSNITIEGIDCIIMHESDLIGIIKS